MCVCVCVCVNIYIYNEYIHTHRRLHFTRWRRTTQPARCPPPPSCGTCCTIRRRAALSRACPRKARVYEAFRAADARVRRCRPPLPSPPAPVAVLPAFGSSHLEAAITLLSASCSLSHSSPEPRPYRATVGRLPASLLASRPAPRTNQLVPAPPRAPRGRRPLRWPPHAAGRAARKRAPGATSPAARSSREGPSQRTTGRRAVDRLQTPRRPGAQAPRRGAHIPPPVRSGSRSRPLSPGRALPWRRQATRVGGHAQPRGRLSRL